MNDESDNLVIRHLRELRAETKTGFDGLRSEGGDLRSEVGERLVQVEAAVADVRGVVLKTGSDVLTVIHRLDEVDTNIRLADRLAAIEQRRAALEKPAAS
jgi:hypothetical protein